MRDIESWIDPTRVSPEPLSRREFFSVTAAAGAATFIGGSALAQDASSAVPAPQPGSGFKGLLYPQQNSVRNVVDLSGVWEFQLDPVEEGEAKGWFEVLPAPRPIFRAGAAEAVLRVPAARFWSPQDPHLYPLTITLNDAQRVIDSCSLNVAKQDSSIWENKPLPGRSMSCTRLSASRAHNTPSEMWTEEYQLEFLRGYLEVAEQRPFMVGMHIWNFADFKTGQGTMRAGAMNHKGVFTRDRRPKMAAHFLRSRWVKK